MARHWRQAWGREPSRRADDRGASFPMYPKRPRLTRPMVRFVLIGLEGYVALTAIICGLVLVVGTHPLPRAWLQGSPLPDYTWLGLIMAIVVGGSSLLAAATMRAGRVEGMAASALAGLLLLGFEVVEVLLIDRNLGLWLLLVLPLQVLYSAISLTLVTLAAWLWRSDERRQDATSRQAARREGRGDERRGPLG